MVASRIPNNSGFGYQPANADTRRYDAPAARSISRYDAPSGGSTRRIDMPGARTTVYRAPSTPTAAPHSATDAARRVDIRA